jgi:hypothetical protein
VDLRAYSVARTQTEEVERRVANGSSIIVRRPVIEMGSLPMAAAAVPSAPAFTPAEPAAGAAANTLDFSLDALDDASPLDVPAFLRRKDG